MRHAPLVRHVLRGHLQVDVDGDGVVAVVQRHAEAVVHLEAVHVHRQHPRLRQKEKKGMKEMIYLIKHSTNVFGKSVRSWCDEVIVGSILHGGPIELFLIPASAPFISIGNTHDMYVLTQFRLVHGIIKIILKIK